MEQDSMVSFYFSFAIFLFLNVNKSGDITRNKSTDWFIPVQPCVFFIVFPPLFVCFN